jgi:hypothetical protein
LEKGVELIATVRKNMKKKFISLWDRAILKKRFIIETANDQLKNISYIEHSRHRSEYGFIWRINCILFKRRKAIVKSNSSGA